MSPSRALQRSQPQCRKRKGDRGHAQFRIDEHVEPVGTDTRGNLRRPPKRTTEKVIGTRRDPLGKRITLPERNDLDGTAALVVALDLVISVDTSLAHLAGALGKPVWVLLPFAPDWRWRMHGDTSAWYPTATLFRQTVAGDWSGPVDAIAAALRRLVATRG
jgi:hypothetical protein